MPRVFTAAVRPSLKSNGLCRRRLMVPATPPSIMFAVLVLNTSAPASASAGRSWNENPRPTPVKISRPSSVVRMSLMPRISGLTISLLSPTNTCTPGTRCSAAAVVLSGNLPMSSATIESTTWSAFCLICAAASRLARRPTTTTSSTSPDWTLVAPGCCCACAAASCVEPSSIAVEMAACSSRFGCLMIVCPLL
jgi:hypothetical protein